MKITKTDVFWWVVMALAALVIVAGCLAMIGKNAPKYDEPAHRTKITAIYPGVDWPEYRKAAREICQLDDLQFDHVRALAADEGPEASEAMEINTAYLCPDRS